MGKLRLEITKGEEIRYISHLDYASAIERTIIRAKLPAAYSEGFNPHMKISFASALAVGVTSQAEYMDIEFKEEVELTEAVKRIMATLPPGILLKRAKYMVGNTPALMAIVNLATYNVLVPLTGDAEATEESIRKFNEATEVLYTRQTPKGRKEIEIKQYMAEPIVVDVQEQVAHLLVDIKITPNGSIKPGEILAALVANFDLPVDRERALIHRTGLYVVENDTKVKPIDL